MTSSPWIDHANGVNTTHLYDAAGRTTVVAHKKAAGTVLERITYTYDDVGNRRSAAANDASLTTYAYDATYRLIDEWRTGANAYRTSHTYDAVGNRTVEETDGSKTTFTYDAANQLKTSEPEDVHDPSITYTYDQAGNLEKRNLGTTVTTYSWDDENRMTGIVFPASGKATFVYNADGLRVKKEDSGGTVKSIWDFQNVLTETNSSNVTQAVYTLAPRLYGNLLSQRRGSTSHFHLFDALGSTVGLTNASETLSDSYLYKAYGETLASSGSTVNPFKWVGRVGYYDDASSVGLHYVRARYYNDVLARWMSEDPLSFRGGDLNLYQYVNSNPVLLGDPSGLLAPPIAGCLIAGEAGLVFDLVKLGIKCVALGCDASDGCGALCNFGGNCLAGALLATLPAGGWPVGCLAGALGSATSSICNALFCSCGDPDICDVAALIATAAAGCFAGNVPPLIPEDTPIGGTPGDSTLAAILVLLGMILPSAKELCTNRDVFLPK